MSSPRQKYYALIRNNKVSNVLDEIDIISYSRKIEILNELMGNNCVDTINSALDRYKTNYLDLNRGKIERLKNDLIYYCKNI